MARIHRGKLIDTHTPHKHANTHNTHTQFHGTNKSVLVNKVPRELERPHARLLLRCCPHPSQHLHSGSVADEPPHAPLQRCLLPIRNRCPGVDLEGAMFLHPRTLSSRIVGSCVASQPSKLMPACKRIYIIPTLTYILTCVHVRGCTYMCLHTFEYAHTD
jgi:hypothetical protein